MCGLDPPAGPKPFRRGEGPRIHPLRKKRFSKMMDGRVKCAKTRFALQPGHDTSFCNDPGSAERQFAPHRARDARVCRINPMSRDSDLTAAPRRARFMRFDAALLCLALSCSNLEAGQRQRVARPCDAQSAADLKEARRVARGQYIADQLGFGGVADRPSRR
jgi:hypothetical protein